MSQVSNESFKSDPLSIISQGHILESFIDKWVLFLKTKCTGSDHNIRNIGFTTLISIKIKELKEDLDFLWRKIRIMLNNIFSKYSFFIFLNVFLPVHRYIDLYYKINFQQYQLAQFIQSYYNCQAMNMPYKVIITNFKLHVDQPYTQYIIKFINQQQAQLASRVFSNQKLSESFPIEVKVDKQIDIMELLGINKIENKQTQTILIGKQHMKKPNKDQELQVQIMNDQQRKQCICTISYKMNNVVQQNDNGQQIDNGQQNDGGQQNKIKKQNNEQSAQKQNEQAQQQNYEKLLKQLNIIKAKMQNLIKRNNKKQSASAANWMEQLFNEQQQQSVFIRWYKQKFNKVKPLNPIQIGTLYDANLPNIQPIIQHNNQQTHDENIQTLIIQQLQLFGSIQPNKISFLSKQQTEPMINILFDAIHMPIKFHNKISIKNTRIIYITIQCTQNDQICYSFIQVSDQQKNSKMLVFDQQGQVVGIITLQHTKCRFQYVQTIQMLQQNDQIQQQNRQQQQQKHQEYQEQYNKNKSVFSQKQELEEHQCDKTIDKIIKPSHIFLHPQQKIYNNIHTTPNKNLKSDVYFQRRRLKTIQTPKPQSEQQPKNWISFQIYSISVKFNKSHDPLIPKFLKIHIKNRQPYITQMISLTKHLNWKLKQCQQSKVSTSEELIINIYSEDKQIPKLEGTAVLKIGLLSLYQVSKLQFYRNSVRNQFSKQNGQIIIGYQIIEVSSKTKRKQSVNNNQQYSINRQESSNFRTKINQQSKRVHSQNKIQSPKLRKRSIRVIDQQKRNSYKFYS